MDRPYSHSHSQSESSPPSLSSAQNSTNDVFTIESSPTRQQRLLQNRNARFPTKKLSISGLSNKLTQLVGNNDIVFGEQSTRNQENKLHKSRSTGTIGKKGSLAVLEEISNTARSRASKKRSDIPIWHDNAERPLLETSPLVASSPAGCQVDFTSPINLDHIQDSFNDMRLQDRAFQDPWSPINKSPPSLRLKPRKRSSQTQFNAEEYIEHIEKELQQIRDEAYSPLTRRPMKEKLRAANKENERLQKELSRLREAFETEVKRTVEHKTLTEVELKRKVRDLEHSLEQKDQIIRDMQHHHEDKRLDDSVIDSLKATIERLELEKQDMEEINLSMNKRNEVLTQLLAMSPTKTTATGFNLGSPVREKRSGRPFSLVLPKPLSPRQISQASSIACSPHPMSSSAISPFKLSPTTSHDGTMHARYEVVGDPQPDLQQADVMLRSPRIQESINRRWTILSDVSAASNSGNEDPKPATRRKTRKFVAGSTQLKPLLLPTLNGESLAFASAVSSPRSLPAELEYMTDLDDTILPTDNGKDMMSGVASQSLGNQAVVENTSLIDDDGPGPAYQRYEVSPLETTDESTTEVPPSDLQDLDGLGLSLSDEGLHGLKYMPRRRHLTMDSMQMMPMPSTPESLLALPRPLFSPAHQDAGQREESDGVSPPETSADEVLHLDKKRKALPSHHSDSPMQRKSARHADYTPSTQFCASPPHETVMHSTASKPTTLTEQLRKARSSDNVLELLRTKNFAAKPLTALTIKTVYQIVSSCTKTARDLKNDPFALARRVLANAWFTNWNMLGKVSWWVLGLFVQPHTSPRVRAPIDWDHYDGESIASRYCGLDADRSAADSCFDCTGCHESLISSRSNQSSQESDCDSEGHTLVTKQKPGWTQSVFLWGKFSAAMMLAISGAVVKGPGEMLKDLNGKDPACSSKHRRCKSCKRPAHGEIKDRETLSMEQHSILDDQTPASIDYRSDTELDSSSILQQIQQTGYDSTLKPAQPRRSNLFTLFTPLSSPHS